MCNAPLDHELERIRKHVCFCLTYCFSNTYLDFFLPTFNDNCYIIIIYARARAVPEGVQTAQTSWASLKDGPQFFLYPVVIVSSNKKMSIAF
jgi:hypothetical protein